MDRFPPAIMSLVNRSGNLVDVFCQVNKIPSPPILYHEKKDWPFGPCGYYRPGFYDGYPRPNDVDVETMDRLRRRYSHGFGINICYPLCQVPAGEQRSRNWSWPGNRVDRTVFGVIAHELGHHCDWIISDIRYRYSGDYSSLLRAESGEKPLTSYCENSAEWFAEIMRLFITNPAFLKLIRPRSFQLICDRFTPCFQTDDWRANLGANCPERIFNVSKKIIEKGD